MHYNPLDKFHKSILGAVSTAETLVLRVKGNFNSVELRVRRDGEEIEKKVALSFNGDFFECNLSLPVGLYWYYFAVDGRFLSLGNDYCAELTDKISCFQLTFYQDDYKVPDWLKGGIIYQIFPDRFSIGVQGKKAPKGKVLHEDLSDTPMFLPDKKGEVQNNDFFGGDLIGIKNKISYLNSLGVTAIYLNPIFKAYSNHRYDTGDYNKIDELLGTEEDLRSLIDECKKNGIKIIIDGVFNHTGSDSIYFNKKGNYDALGAYQSKNSPYYKWFKFIKYPDLYESWWGIKTLPATDKDNEEFLNFIAGENGVLEKYIKMGIGGVRLDVVDELPTRFVRKIRDIVKKTDNEAVIIGEVWEDASNKIAYDVRREYFLGKELDSVMNYPLKNAIISYVLFGDVSELENTIKTQIDHYPKQVLDILMNMLATHDTFRLISALSGKDVSSLSKTEMSKIRLSDAEREIAILRCKIASLIQYTLYGVPSVYYGDEIGMEGYKDPLNRKFFEWDKIGNELNIWYAKLGKIRKELKVFAEGETTLVYAKGGALCFKRESKNGEVLIAVNLEDNEVNLDFDGELFELISEKTYQNSVTLNKNEFGIFVNLA